MNKKKVLLWFRNDLRLHDNESLQEALATADEIYPVYVFDDRVFKGQSSYGLRKTGKFRARFILDSVADLRNSLEKRGSSLIVRSGYPEEIIFDLAKELKTTWVFCNRERTYEEVLVQDNLEKNLWSIGQEVRYSRGKMLFYTADLPFPVTHTPDVFTSFRKEVEKIVPIRPPFPTPDFIPPIPDELDPGALPCMADWGFSREEIASTDDLIFNGGESEGLKRLNHYFWETDHIAHYKKTRNELIGRSYSSKFSPYLAQGCLSPKLIYAELKRYEEERTKNDSTYHLYFELLWRDFFRLMGKKYGNEIFKKSGIKNEERIDLEDNHEFFRIWCEGRTGMPFVDAAMTELNTTGYMSNRARQNAASFLINDLKVNWQMGAEYFESLLIDYDVCSNWGNWNYVAGVGNDPREGRYFNILNQARKYDPEGRFVKKWIPSLNNLPSDKIHQPYLLTNEEQSEYECKLHREYPDLCIKKEIYQ